MRRPGPILVEIPPPPTYQMQNQNFYKTFCLYVEEKNFTTRTLMEGLLSGGRDL